MAKDPMTVLKGAVVVLKDQQEALDERVELLEGRVELLEKAPKPKTEPAAKGAEGDEIVLFRCPDCGYRGSEARDDVWCPKCPRKLIRMGE